MDPHYVLSLVGATKLLTVILGVASYGLALYSYDETILQDELFHRSVQICFYISAFYFAVCMISGQVVRSEVNRAIDIVWHVSGCAALFLGSSLFIYTAIDNQIGYCGILAITYPEHFCQFYGEKLAGEFITAFNSICYGLVAILLFLRDTRESPNSMLSRNGRQAKGELNGEIFKVDRCQHLAPPQLPHQQKAPRFMNSLPKSSFYYGEKY